MVDGRNGGLHKWLTAEMVDNRSGRSKKSSQSLMADGRNGGWQKWWTAEMMDGRNGGWKNGGRQKW
jgi:hypothetical protein